MRLLRHLPALLVLAAPALAQSGTDSARVAAVLALPVGATVRVHTRELPGAPFRGAVLTRSPATLGIGGTRDSLRVPVASIVGIEELTRRRSGGAAVARGMLQGFLVGAAIGGTATIVSAATEPECADCWVTRTAFVAAGGVLFTGVATIVGGALGAGRREVWEWRYPDPR